MTEILAQWKCPNGHVLGQVMRNGNGVRVLLLYRFAIDLGTACRAPTGTDTMAVIEGYAADIRCSICEEIRTWVPGEEALRRLFEMARRENG